jgi:hypothetical protein
MRSDDRRRLLDHLRTIALIVIAVVAVTLAVMAVRQGGR